ncbi:hypothetical protein BN7_227 [Wickerhamomyces ciferrii]|uniref:Uncharacterized protein n=1 Tax=Wickerhamomyces ciferrii (strain ATCC 14091 / BCRC 22168 / CBS 111 / JCM 3599 / NBRC 0793 / NRRL Y-1031 F-60-10) TaxID=1206466 RepID=K0KHQ7_WICCF|nr:uncharacterized protein BN7_227 [Wickerhamomyces ciferrii]CCH40693.1 hypothetical protein BN7_227 [Wickerhamomyces ciferrii]
MSSSFSRMNTDPFSQVKQTQRPSEPKSYTYNKETGTSSEGEKKQYGKYQSRPQPAYSQQIELKREQEIGCVGSFCQILCCVPLWSKCQGPGTTCCGLDWDSKGPDTRQGYGAGFI